MRHLRSKIMISGDDDLYDVPEVVLRLSKSIRHCAVIDKSGNVVASKNRDNLQPLVEDQNHHKEALQAAMRHSKTPSWARNLGKMYYNVSRYERVIGATIPLPDGYLMLVALDHDADAFDRIIMTKILPAAKRIFMWT